jgi:hypothetical protein
MGGFVMAHEKQALETLLAKVEAGYGLSIGDAGFISDQNGHGVLLPFSAYDGSFDAVLALHDAVVPEQSIRIERRSGGWVVWLDSPHQGIDATKPARAWLIAILRALIAQENTQ